MNKSWLCEKKNAPQNFCLPSFLLDVSAVNEATFTWSGQLPPRNNKDPLYSCKVFLGGVPWDITEGNCCFIVI